MSDYVIVKVGNVRKYFYSQNLQPEEGGGHFEVEEGGHIKMKGGGGHILMSGARMRTIRLKIRQADKLNKAVTSLKV